MGFEPTNGGFADLSLGPLGYRAGFFSIANLNSQPAIGVGLNLHLLEALPKSARLKSVRLSCQFGEPRDSCASWRGR